jgi:replication factor A1
MNDTEIMQTILSKCPDVTEQQLLDSLEAEKRKTAGLIADQTLLRLIAARYNVEIPSEIMIDCKLRISHLVQSLNNVTVAGRVVAVYPAKAFEGKQSGKYASVIIADSSGLLRVMLWNNKAEIVESGAVTTGQVVRFSRGYTREDRNGMTELHISEKGDVEISSDDLRNDEYPSIERFATPIKAIAQHQNVHLVGRVKAVFPSSTFTRQDNSLGKVMRFTVTDDTGDVVVVAWNGKAETLEASLKAEAEIKLVNAKVKPAASGSLEVHVDDFTYVEFSSTSRQS